MYWQKEKASGLGWKQIFRHFSGKAGGNTISQTMKKSENNKKVKTAKSKVNEYVTEVKYNENEEIVKKWLNGA